MPVTEEDVGRAPTVVQNEMLGTKISVVVVLEPPVTRYT